MKLTINFHLFVVTLAREFNSARRNGGNCLQRKGLTAGVELEFRLLGTAADLKVFVEDKNYCSALLVLPEQPLKIDLLNIVLPSSHTCGKPL